MTILDQAISNAETYLKSEADKLATGVGKDAKNAASAGIIATGTLIGGPVGAGVATFLAGILQALNIRGKTVRLAWESANAMAIPVANTLTDQIYKNCTPDQIKWFAANIGPTFSGYLANTLRWKERRQDNLNMAQTVSKEIPLMPTDREKIWRGFWLLLVWTGTNVPADRMDWYRGEIKRTTDEVFVPFANSVESVFPSPVKPLTFDLSSPAVASFGSVGFWGGLLLIGLLFASFVKSKPQGGAA